MRLHIINILERVAAMEELGDVATHIVLEGEFAAGVRVHKGAYIQYEIFQENNLAALFEHCIEIIQRN